MFIENRCVLKKYDGSEQSIVIPRSVVEISGKCFYRRGSLSEITFEEGSNLKKIGEWALKESGLKRLQVPKSVEEIGKGCFCFCDFFSEITFEEGSNIKKIGEWAFKNSCLKSFRVPNTIEDISTGLFYGCLSLSEITFEEGSKPKKIGEQVFEQCRFKSFRVPKSVEEIGRKCFYGCRCLSEVTFEEGSNLKKIGESVFEKCSSLSSIAVAKSDWKHLSGLLGTFGIPLRAITEVRVSKKPLSERVEDITEYERIKTLGRGGFGDVFLYKKGNSQVAAKFIPASDERNQECFEREIGNLNSLSHPFIVGLRGFSLPSQKTQNNFVVIMEYIPGGSLQDVMKNPPSWFDNTSKIEIICGIALGMSFVHSNGIIHRDLKPANVLLDENHLPRVCDFGSSRLFSTDSTITTSPNITPVYEAPEVYDGVYTEKIDVYSFGVMLYELVTGKLAFRNFSPAQIMKHVVFGKREPIPDTVTPFARDLIERCWVQDPESRPSFDEICALLKNNLRLLFKDCDSPRLAQFRGKYFT